MSSLLVRSVIKAVQLLWNLGTMTSSVSYTATYSYLTQKSYNNKQSPDLPVDIPVETVVQGNSLELHELNVSPPGLHVEVLESPDVGLVVGQGDGPHVHQTSLGVVVQDLGDVGMDVQLIEKYLSCPESSGYLYPLHQLDTDVLSGEVQTFAADSELLLPLILLERLKHNFQTVPDVLTVVLHDRHDGRDLVLVTLR